MPQFGAWEIGETGRPHRLESDRDFLEKHFEEWIKADPTLLGGDVRWVAQQLHLPGYRLDLFGVDADGTWVIAELKPGPVGGGTIIQALGYFLELAVTTNQNLVDRVRARGVVDEAVEPHLARLESLPDETERPCRLIVAGVGTGDGAVAAADVLAAHGLDLDVRVITFELVRIEDETRSQGFRRVLIREADDEVRPRPQGPSQSWTLESLLGRASEFGVREGFDEMRALLDARGFSTVRKRFGLNFNLGGRLQSLWIEPRQGSIYVSYLSSNMGALFEVSESEALQRLGPSEHVLPPDQAVDQVRTWADELLVLQAEKEARLRSDAATEG